MRQAPERPLKCGPTFLDDGSEVISVSFLFVGYVLDGRDREGAQVVSLNRYAPRGHSMEFVVRRRSLQKLPASNIPNSDESEEVSGARCQVSGAGAYWRVSGFDVQPTETEMMKRHECRHPLSAER